MATTVEQLYSMTKAIMFEKPSSNIYDNYLIANLNRVLVELFQENNVLRVFNGKKKYDRPQQVSGRTDTLLYEDEIVLNVLPLGLASRFLIDDDLNKYSIFATDYNNARVMAQKLVSKEKLDAAETESII